MKFRFLNDLSHFNPILIAFVLGAAGSGPVLAQVIAKGLGVGQVLAQPRIGDRAPPTPIGLAPPMRQQAVATNQWYSALIFSQTPEVIFAQPLSVRAPASGFEIALPTMQVVPTERQDTEIHYPHRNPMVLAPAAFQATQGKLAKSSDWSIDIAMGNADARFDLTVGHGSPYVFARLDKSPISVRFSQAAQQVSLSADPRVLTLQSEGQTFAVFGPTGVRWENKAHNEWLGHLPNGKKYFSAAVLPDAKPETVALFTRHAYAFPTNTRVNWTYNEQRSLLKTDFSATTELMEGQEARTLMGLYPHHWHQNPGVQDQLSATYNTIRGPIRIMMGNQFSTEYKYNGFVPYWPGVKDHPRQALLMSLLSTDVRDARRNMLQIGNGPYWQGKGLQRISKVLDVAEQQGDVQAAQRLQSLLKERIEQWFSGKDRKTYFHLDKTLGTVLAYPEEYFSVEQMNDHHFHYGYWIRTMADLALRDPEWAARERWGGMTDLLIKDIATAERGRADFPFLRNFDPYEGHSWASGVGLGPLGNNQESSSEAINAWAGLILWAEIQDDKALRDLGLYLYTSEIEAIRHYWFDVHQVVLPPDYKNKEVSMLFGGAYKHNTWWTDEPRQIKGINLLPITTSSTYLGFYPEHTRKSLATLPGDTRVYESRGKTAKPVDIWQDIFAQYMGLTSAQAGLQMWDRWGSVELGDTRTHALHFLLKLEEMGTPDRSVTADTVLYAVFKRTDGQKTYLAYNTRPVAKTVHFSDGQVLQVQPRSLAHHRSNAKP